jgi:hypothetical protein
MTLSFSDEFCEQRHRDYERHGGDGKRLGAEALRDARAIMWQAGAYQKQRWQPCKQCRGDDECFGAEISGHAPNMGMTSAESAAGKEQSKEGWEPGTKASLAKCSFLLRKTGFLENRVFPQNQSQHDQGRRVGNHDAPFLRLQLGNCRTNRSCGICSLPPICNIKNGTPAVAH